VKAAGLIGGVVAAAVGFVFLLSSGKGERAESLRTDGSPIRVEVLNGSGESGAGLILAEELRDVGFDVVAIGNARRFDYERTLVLDRVGQPEYARRVASALGVEPSVQQRNTDILLDVTVILGKDRATARKEGA
jgi:hypothetical protein